jgi:muramidase (phage lysozyme)
MILHNVGLGERNDKTDVKEVQHLLNVAQIKLRAAKFLFHPFPRLIEDGNAGRRTIEAIRIFQRDVVRVRNPDGRIALGKSTISTLVSTASGMVPPVPAGTLTLSSSAADLVKDPRVKAMLDVIGFTEGTGTDYGKIVNGLVLKSPFFPNLVGQRNVRITDLTRHPEILVQVRIGLNSQAAGRYQFLFGTWKEQKMPDFTAPSQDIAAVKLFKIQKMIEPLLLGQIDVAVYKGAPRWASLPTKTGGSYWGGQPARKISEIKQLYANRLKTYQNTQAATLP